MENVSKEEVLAKMKRTTTLPHKTRKKAEISWVHNERIELGESVTHRMYSRQKGHRKIVSNLAKNLV